MYENPTPRKRDKFFFAVHTSFPYLKQIKKDLPLYVDNTPQYLAKSQPVLLGVQLGRLLSIYKLLVPGLASNIQAWEFLALQELPLHHNRNVLQKQQNSGTIIMFIGPSDPEKQNSKFVLNIKIKIKCFYRDIGDFHTTSIY